VPACVGERCAGLQLLEHGGEGARVSEGEEKASGRRGAELPACPRRWPCWLRGGGRGDLGIWAALPCRPLEADPAEERVALARSAFMLADLKGYLHTRIKF
jgi:hypothetical protein